MTFPKEFSARITAQLGAEFPDFEAAHRQPPPVSIRLNPAKRIAPSPDWEKIAWHPDGFYLPERPKFTLDPRFHAGAFYVQEASSMFLDFALRQVVDFSKPLKILDLCAAPGGKSTLLASLLREAGGLLVANEVIRTRSSPLRENLEKWGFPNLAIASAEASDFGKMAGKFDAVVVDAPCSGEGMFRKDPNAMSEWSPANVDLCAARQRKILAEVAPALAEGGVLVYSTCTFNPSENDENVDWLLSQSFDFQKVGLKIPADWGIVERAGGWQFFQHLTRGEGFFISIFRKKSSAESPAEKPSSGKNFASAKFQNLKNLDKTKAAELKNWLSPNFEMEFFETASGEVRALPTSHLDDYLFLDKHLKTKWFGTMVGEFKGKEFVPSHALATSELAAADLPSFDLGLENALRFLRKEPLEVSDSMPRGWALAKFEDLSLGWAKVLPNRMNNYLPVERRILMR